MSSEFKKYMNSYRAGSIVGTIFMGLYSLFCIYGVIVNIAAGSKESAGMSLFLFLVFGAGVVYFISRALKFKKFFDNLSESGELSIVEADFLNAKIRRNDTVRFGERYIYIKKSGKLVKYEDIKQVYQYVHKTNFIETERALKYKDQNGKEYYLCKLELRDKSRNEMVEIISLLLAKNPNIKIGYR